MGKMSSTQMIKHCSCFIDLYLGKLKFLFGTNILVLQLENFFYHISKKSPLETPKNIRTEKSIKIIDENLDFDYEKNY